MPPENLERNRGNAAADHRARSGRHDGGTGSRQQERTLCRKGGQIVSYTLGQPVVRLMGWSSSILLGTIPFQRHAPAGWIVVSASEQ
jgi:hypothetical protein